MTFNWEDSAKDLVKEKAIALRRSLLSWYVQQGRDLPWRQTRDPYRIWISEIMLQQTQVKTVIPYYERWLAEFPTVEALAIAELQSVLKCWEGLGYYARARNLHKAAQQIVSQHNSIFPNTLEEAIALPGIGRTTAGGILSSASNLPVSILDGNVKRVLARLVALPTPPAKAINLMWQLSDRLLDPDSPRDFNQAIMDLGATLCTRSHPNCQECPWRDFCQAYSKGIQNQLPMREQSSPIPHKVIGVAVIWNEQGQILIDRRPAKGLLGGLWEFPGGKVEENEAIADCIKREILEELDIEIEVGKHLITVDHAYTHFRVSLVVHHCRYLGGEPKAIGCDEIRWVTLEEIDQFPFPKANNKIIAALRENQGESS
ncbi:MAG: A/G-specific adenine glycosylase [Chroococcales cyanobacterium]